MNFFKIDSLLGEEGSYNKCLYACTSWEGIFGNGTMKICSMAAMEVMTEFLGPRRLSPEAPHTPMLKQYSRTSDRPASAATTALPRRRSPIP
jgi:hypothetical protein